jgi:hypothetical protein
MINDFLTLCSAISVGHAKELYRYDFLIFDLVTRWRCDLLHAAAPLCPRKESVVFNGQEAAVTNAELQRTHFENM